MAKPENAKIEEPAEKVIPITDSEAETAGSPGAVAKRPFALGQKRGSGGGNLPLMLTVLGAIVIFGIGMIAFLSSKGTIKKKTAAEAAKPNLGRIIGAISPGDLIPSDRAKPSPDEAKKGGTLDAADIEKTKSPKINQRQAITAQSNPNGGKRLNQVGKFEEPDTTPNGQPKWTPPPYGGSESDALGTPSLVFTAHNQSNGGLRSGRLSDKQSIDNLGLSPGYHVAAQLEYMATTAVHASVTASVEYNYERDGQVLIPAGSIFVGKITQADPSGVMNIAFSSIQFPGGEPIPIDAVAANMNLQALKGKVTGKQAGRSFLIRSVSDIGETLATVWGQGNANSALSEDDLIRMRVAENIGNASDQQIMQMMTMQHIVVSLPARTEIYVIFEKSPQADVTGASKTVHVPRVDNSALDSSTPSQP
jgi:hypothetical protein